MPRRSLSEPARSFELHRPPRRGEVYWVAFGPAVGGETQKTRPAVVVSNDAANTALNRLQVVPITSQTARVYPSEALVRLRGEPRKAMADQLTTASRKRLVGYLGSWAPRTWNKSIGRSVCNLPCNGPSVSPEIR